MATKKSGSKKSGGAKKTSKKGGGKKASKKNGFGGFGSAHKASSN